ncbi:hypothetical protein [Runella salmonicolor]|uniref:Uncharacterized protein n=1 Tax=Runella salmonicolor TaxID=2950278 RepID=A0ABT1FSS5_9BACT|nr:hypothetical protein [Runella salmonicolor]MCP1384814.1 hypothetical protein [Runella salmonicolor]
MKVNNINNYVGEVDLFIFSSGFERRSTKLGESLNDLQLKQSYVFHLDETYKISYENIIIVKKNIPKTEIVVYPKNNPLETFSIYNGIISKFIENNFKNDKLKVVIDITTFTREVMLILIKVLSNKSVSRKLNVLLVYTPAKSYSESKESLWLTKGVRDIRSVVGYSGLHSPSKKLLLIVLTGFEEERTERIIESFEPFKLILGKPSQKHSINSELNIISNQKFDLIKDKFKRILLEEFEFSCQNIGNTKDIISQIHNKYRNEYNIVISPLNNKVSTIAVGIAGLENQDIQICYASANQYNIDTPHEACNYFLCFNLSRLL